MKTVWTGQEGQGKSLKLAMVAKKLVDRNASWLEKQEKDYVDLGVIGFQNKYKREKPIARSIKSKFAFSTRFEVFAEQNRVPIHYFSNKRELVQFSEADVLIDEMASFWNSRMWQEITLEEMDWLNQGNKSGIELYGASLDFSMVDKNFRILCNHLYYVKKLVGSPRPAATKPPIKKIWGVCLVWELDPKKYDEQSGKFSNLYAVPEMFWIDRDYCELFDTNKKMSRSALMPYRHIERECMDPDCTFHKVVHV